MPAFLPSELPVRAVARQHWIVLLRPPRRLTAVLLTVLFVAAWIRPDRFAWVFVLAAAFMLALRWREWRAERVLLTGKRIIHVQGTVETTSSENSLRVDRVSGVRFIETVPGKMFGFATIELEAPGNHPGVSRLKRLGNAEDFYLELRDVVYGEHHRDPDEDPYGDPDERTPGLDAYVTAPIPSLAPIEPPPRPRPPQVPATRRGPGRHAAGRRPRRDG